MQTKKRTNRLLAMLLTLVMCFATVAPTVVMAETPTDVASRYIAYEDFSDPVNTSGANNAFTADNAFLFGKTNGTAFTQEDGTLRYTYRNSGDEQHIRFWHAGQESLKAQTSQDFILSFKIKPLVYSIGGLPIKWCENGKTSWESAVTFTSGRLFVNGKCYSDYELYYGEWTLVEIAFHYNESATSDDGVSGAVDSFDVLINGEVAVANVTTKYKVHSIDYFRMFQWVNGIYELEDFTVATGNESLASARGFNSGYTTRTHFYHYDDAISSDDYAYSMALIGDTQTIVRYTDTADAKLNALYGWLINNKDAKKIQYVMGLGDITNDNTVAEYEVASKHINRLTEAGIPHSVVRGNHDTVRDGVLDSTLFNRYFATESYMGQFDVANGNGGFYKEGSVENSWRKLHIGNTDYLFVTLDNGASDAELAWAGEIIAANPDHKVIITTHTYLYNDTTTVDDHDSSAPTTSPDFESNNGDDFWNKLIRKYENILLVVSGHVACDEVVTTQVKGDHGNIVTQMLVNFQTVDAHFGAAGMVTMLYFSEDGNTVKVETYSPIKEQYFLEENQFSFKFDPDVIYSNDFNNPGEDTPGVVSADLFGAQNLEASFADSSATFSVPGADSNKWDNFISIRAHYAADAASVVYDRDLRLSFKLKTEKNLWKAEFGCSNNGSNQCGFMKISENVVTVGSTKCQSIVVGEWNQFDILFHYNDSTKQYTSYTIVLNGDHVGTFALTTPTAKVDRFELFRYFSTADSYAIDDLYYGFDSSTVLYQMDFSEEAFEVTQPLGTTVDGVRILNKGYYDAEKSGVANGVLTMVHNETTGGEIFLDAHYYDQAKPFGDHDLTLSVKIKPIGTAWNNDAFISVNHAGGNLIVARYADAYNKFKIDDTVVTLSQEKFSTVEAMFHYDDDKGVYTSVDVYVNGAYIDSVDISAGNCSDVKYFRLFRVWSSDMGMKIDSLTVASGCQSLYNEEFAITKLVGYQASELRVDEEDVERYDIRLLGVMNTTDYASYANVGFKVTLKYQDGGSLEMPEAMGVCREVYSSVIATVGITKTYTAAELGGEAIFALNITNLAAANGPVTFVVTTYYTIAGQEAVETGTVEFTVDPTTDLPQQEVN